MTLDHGPLRQRLIETVLRLMAEGGLEAVKARTLASDAGVSVGTIYNLFGTIDDVILAANTEIYAELNAVGRRQMEKNEVELARLIEAGEMNGAGRERALYRLLGLARTYVEFVAANAERWSALLAFNRTRKIAATDAAYLGQQDALIDIIGDVLQTTSLGNDPSRRRLAARALWSSVHGIVVMNYFGADTQKARHIAWAQIELLVTAFVHGVSSD